MNRHHWATLYGIPNDVCTRSGPRRFIRFHQSFNRPSDALGAEEYSAEEVAGAPVHPFARAIAGEEDEFDDSFDSMDGDDGGRCEGEVGETVFTVWDSAWATERGKRRVGS